MNGIKLFTKGESSRFYRLMHRRLTHRNPLLSGACCGLLAWVLVSGTSMGAVIFQDTFTGGANANSSTYPRWNNTNGTISGISNDTVIGTGDALQISTTDTILTRPFTDTSLSIGETMQLSFDFHKASDASTGSIIRFGLYDLSVVPTDGNMATTSATKDGYYVFFRDNNTSNAALREDMLTGTDAILTNSSPTLQNVSADVDWGTASVKHSLLFTVTRDTATQNTVTAQLYVGGVLSNYDFSAIVTGTDAFTSFNTFGIRTDTNTAASPLILDNVTVQVVPEPGTLGLLLGAGVLFWVFRRGSRPSAQS